MNENVTLRPWRTEDLDELVQLANNPKIARFMMDAFPSPYTLKAGELFIANASAVQPEKILAVIYADKIAGSIGIHPQSDVMRLNAEIGYWIGEPYWGKGIATAAVKLITAYAFRNFEINRLFARPYGTNKASQRVLEKAGYVLESRIKESFIKNGVMLDELIYAVRKT